ncbi:MAG: biopolymer transporter ExbD [Paludibacteraceae bacterium]|nr:biopolymer transporter ExbD [Paludibacteraceae bacterium]MBR6043665.1 biopolymer transporter ExbD [Paludibacteraceae bacterium]MCR5567799.1 biopolymer transporter ExbD [Paludibacteraceae bacterium]
MALKRRNKPDASFNMSSMTDFVFQILVFFMLTSAVVHPNAIKVNLPQSNTQTKAKPLARVVIDKDLNYYVGFGSDKEQPIPFEQLESWLQNEAVKEPDMYVALYGETTVPLGEVVKVLSIANANKFKLVIATQPLESAGKK